MLADFKNSFIGRLTIKFPIKSSFNIPPHLKPVATLYYFLWNTKVSCVNKNISEGSVTTHLKCGGTFNDDDFIASLLLGL